MWWLRKQVGVEHEKFPWFSVYELSAKTTADLKKAKVFGKDCPCRGTIYKARTGMRPKSQRFGVEIRETKKITQDVKEQKENLKDMKPEGADMTKNSKNDKFQDFEWKFFNKWCVQLLLIITRIVSVKIFIPHP